jgi:chaperonin GroES
MIDKKPNVRPLGDRVIVKRVKPDERSKGGIIIPEAVQEKANEGIVQAVGRGRRLDNGHLLEPEVKAGDRILFGKYSGTETKVDGEDVLIITEGDIHCVIGD